MAMAGGDGDCPDSVVSGGSVVFEGSVAPGQHVYPQWTIMATVDVMVWTLV
jgi:hypothetical protein